MAGLDSHLLLDGHDRLAAALHVGTLPRVLVLWQSLEVPSLDEPDDEFLANYAALFENPEVNELARIQLNAKLVAQHRDTHRRAITLAKARRHMREEWNAEVLAAAPVLEHDVDPDALDLLYDG